MKRSLVILIVLISVFCLAINVNASESQMPEEYDDLLQELPDDIVELLPDELFSSNFNDIVKGIKELSGWEYIINIIFDIIGLNLKDVVKMLAVICSILVVTSTINAIKTTFKNEATNKVIQMICGIVFVMSIIELSREPLAKTVSLLDNMRLFINTLSPLICSMYAMGGNVSSALVSNYGMIVFLTIFDNICVIALEIILNVCISITLASAFLGEGNLTSLSSAIKKGFTFFIGLLMLVFTTVISTQSLLASKADTLTSKTAKMLASQMIPLVGGTVGESLKTAGASIEYLRSSVGVLLVVVLFLIILPTLISIFLYRATLIISNAVAGLLGCRKEGAMLMELSSIYGYVIAILSICAIGLLFLITIFAKSASPLKL